MAHYYGVKHDYSQHKAFTEALEYFDLGDRETRDSLQGLHEEDQSKVLMSLTTRLYDQIINKVDDIDYGDIPRTKGDIERLSNYSDMRECTLVLSDLFKEYKQDVTPVTTISVALDNLVKDKDVYMRGFLMKAEYPMMIYNTIALSVVQSLSLLIATTIEFIKSPTDDSIDMILNNAAATKTSRHLLFENLKKFNEACSSGDMRKSIEFVTNKKNLLGGIGVFGGAILGLGIVMNIIPLLRELIYYFYHIRVSFSDYLAIQADLLQINAYNLEHNRVGKDAQERKKIAKRQMIVVANLRKVSNFIAVSAVTAEKEATVDIVKDSKQKFKADEVLDSKPESSGSSSIF